MYILLEKKLLLFFILGYEIIMVLKTSLLDYQCYIFYTFLALLSTLLTLSLVTVARCCADRATANVDKVGTVL